MELRLSEEFLILALNERTGTAAPFKPMLLKYTLAAAVLQDLIIHGKLEVDGDLIKVSDKGPTGDAVLDKALNIVTESQKEKKIQHCVSKLSGKSKDLKGILLEDLVNKGIFRSLDEQYYEYEPTRRFAARFRHGKRFRIWNDMPLKKLHKQLLDILVYGKAPDERSLRLIGLIKACKLTRNIFKNEKDQEIAERRGAELSETDKFKKAVRGAVRSFWVSIVTGIGSGLFGLIKEAC
jgi:Golgi phosphoprotein 3